MKSVLILATSAFAASSTYDHHVGDVAYYYAFGSYCPKEMICSWTEGMGDGYRSQYDIEFGRPWRNVTDENKQFQVSDVIYFSGPSGDDPSSQAFVGWDPVHSRVIISLRGPLRPDKFSFDSVPVSYAHGSGATVHPEFYTNWTTLAHLADKGLSYALRQQFLTHPGADVLVTGYGFGGALATICAVELKHSFVDSTIGNVDLITFGAPRVGNGAFVSLVMEATRDRWRIVNRYDMVATVPSKALGYRHMPTQIWYQYEQDVSYWDRDPLSFKVCDGTGEDSACFGADFWDDRLPEYRDHRDYFGRDQVCGFGPGGSLESKSRMKMVVGVYTKAIIPNFLW